jgi:hypothetical protein
MAKTNKLELRLAALTLHKVRIMKQLVAILAVAMQAGCGVGADETYDGVRLIGTTEQGLEQAAQAPLAAPRATQTAVKTSTSTLRDPGAVGLPQDPIPVHDGRPAQPLPMKGSLR